MPLIGKNPIFNEIFYSLVFSELIQPYAEEVLTRQVMLSLLKDYKRPNDKINELVKNGQLTMLKKGMYIPGAKLNIARPEPFLVANHLWGPSYVSLEAALSYWGLIPERVYEISSVTLKNTKTFTTEVGRFSYQHANVPYYSFGIRSIELSPKQVALIASPEKAICDKVIMTTGIFLRSKRQAKAFLLEDLRLDEEKLKELNLDEIEQWLAHAQKASSLDIMIKTLRLL